MSPDEAFVAELSIASPEIRTLSDLVPDVLLRMVDEYRDRDGREVAIFWVRAADFDEFESSLSESTLFDDWQCLVRTGDQRLYSIVVASRAELAGVIDVSRRYNIVWERVTVRDGRIFIRAIVPNRDALHSFREDIRDRGYDFGLRRVTSEIEAGIDELPAISDRQREVLELAFEHGYYEQPREVTLAEIGEELGISESAVSGRLTRGLSAILGEVLDPDRDAPDDQS